MPYAANVELISRCIVTKHTENAMAWTGPRCSTVICQVWNYTRFQSKWSRKFSFSSDTPRVWAVKRARPCGIRTADLRIRRQTRLRWATEARAGGAGAAGRAGAVGVLTLSPYFENLTKIKENEAKDNFEKSDHSIHRCIEHFNRWYSLSATTVQKSSFTMYLDRRKRICIQMTSRLYVTIR